MAHGQILGELTAGGVWGFFGLQDSMILREMGVRKPCKSSELRVTGPTSGQIRCSSNLFVAKKTWVRLPLIFESSSFTSLDFPPVLDAQLVFLLNKTSIFDLRFESKRDELQKKINTLLDAWTSSGRDLRLRWRQQFLRLGVSDMP